MKEAAGEANMTVITIVLIAIVLLVGTLVVNRLMTSMRQKSCCADAGGSWTNNACAGGDAATYTACIGETNPDATTPTPAG